MKLIDLIPASRIIDLLVVDTDQYAGNFEHDLIDHLEEEGYEFVSIFDDHICRRSRKSAYVESPAGTQVTSLGLCLEDGTDMITLEQDIRKFFANYEYRHVSDESITEVSILGFRQMKARVIEFD